MIHLLTMLCNIGDLHVVDRKIFALARKKITVLWHFCCFVNQTGRCLITNCITYCIRLYTRLQNTLVLLLYFSVCDIECLCMYFGIIYRNWKL